MKHRSRYLLALLAAALGPLPAAHASEPAAPAAPDQVLVRFEPGAAAAERSAARAAADAKVEQVLDMPGWQLLHVPAGTVDEAQAALSGQDGVADVQPNYRYRATFVPNDPYFRSLWSFQNLGQEILGVPGNTGADIRATQAWDVTSGSPAVPVAVVDTGVDLAHPDLAGAAWVNPGESGGGRETNGIDDDRDGFVDDVHGWDWVGGDNSPADEDGHGTHVAGTIGARGGNGVGVVGVAFNASLMPLRVLDSGGSGWTSDIAQAFTYAAAHGVRVVNASLGGAGADPLLEQAIARAPNTLFVVAAGNSGQSSDRVPEYPCSYPEQNIICVGASDQQDHLAAFSNYGAGSVDIAAPGVAIASTWNDGGYGYMDGTSMATPQVSGVAALVLARHPDWSAQQVRQALLASADHVQLGRPVSSGGRLDAYAAVTYGAPVPAPVAAPPVARDSQPPRATLRVRSRARLRQLLHRGLPARCASAEAGTCTLQLVIGQREGRRVALRASVLGHARARLAHPGSATVRLRLARGYVPKLRRALHRRHRVRLDVRVSVVDQAGNVTRLDRRLRLRG